MDKTNLQIIREAFGRVVYSHKTHEKAAEIENSRGVFARWANVVLTTLTSGTLLSTIITNQTMLIYVSACLAALTLHYSERTVADGGTRLQFAVPLVCRFVDG